MNQTERDGALIAALLEALFEEWQMNHDEHCTNNIDADHDLRGLHRNFWSGPVCYHPLPIHLLADPKWAAKAREG